jgi:hypothetical protein
MDRSGTISGRFWLSHMAHAPLRPASIRQRLRKVLRATNDDIDREPLPQRWIDLIRYLDEKERLGTGRPALKSGPGEAPEKK